MGLSRRLDIGAIELLAREIADRKSVQAGTDHLLSLAVREEALLKRLLLVAAAVLALGGSEASARTTILCDPCSYPYQRWVDEAKVPTPDEVVTLVEDSTPCREGSACTEAGPGGNIFLDPAHFFEDPFFVENALLHEIGHRFDYTLATEEMRAGFMAILGDTRAWRQSPNSPHENFAEVYSLCAAYGSTLPDFVSVDLVPSGRVGRRQYTQLCVLLGSAPPKPIRPCRPSVRKGLCAARPARN
jgi:hypothetical protein